MGVERLPAQGRQHEGGAVAVLPVDNSPDALAVHVGGVVLGPDEAVLYQTVGERVDAVTVGSPGEDLQPDWSTLIGRAPTLLRSHWSRAS